MDLFEKKKGKYYAVFKEVWWFTKNFTTGRPQLNVTICFVHRMITVGPIVIKFHPQKAVILRNCKSI